jgi:dUTP pyrophosphatase
MKEEGKMEDNVKVSFIKVHPDAKLPSKAFKSDSCFDLYCCEKTTIPGSKVIDGNFVLGTARIPIGLKVGYITPGWSFATKNKSGISANKLIIRAGGEFDNSYRGSVEVPLYNLSNEDHTFEVGDKVVQFKIERVVQTEINFIDEPVEASCSRGENGFGSSGKK